MNKKILALALAAMLALSLAGCGGAPKEDPAPSEPASQSAPAAEALDGPAVMEKMAAANALSSMAETYGPSGIETVEYYADGTEVSSLLYRDETRLIQDYPGETAIVEDGKVYTISKKDGSVMEFFYPGEAFDLWVGPYLSYSQFAYLPEAEPVDSCELKDGKYFIRSHEAENTVDYVGYYGYTDVVGMRYEYTVDAETFLVTEHHAYMDFKDGSSKMFFTVVTKTGMEKLEVPEEIRSRVFSEDTRLVTFYEDAETSYSIRVAKGVPVSFLPAYDGAWELYEDAAFTVPVTASGDFDRDVTVYMKKLDQ